MKWFIGFLILVALANTVLALITWADISVVNDNLFLVYGQCVPGQDS